MTAFADLLADLGRSEVDFVLVGGLAVAIAGYARTTEDVDVLVEASEPNLRRLLAVLARFGEGHGAVLSPADFPLEEGCIRIAEDFDLDIFTLLGGQTYADLRPLSAEHDVQGVPIRTLTAEGLIRLKSDSVRPKDQLDVEVLRRLSDRS